MQQPLQRTNQPAGCPPPPLPQCHGTKTLRRRPGYLRTRDFGIVDDPRDSYLCFYCGPHTKVRRQAADCHAHWSSGRTGAGGLLHVTHCSVGSMSRTGVSAACRSRSCQPLADYVVATRVRLSASWLSYPLSAAQFDTNPFAEDDEQRSMEIQASGGEGGLGWGHLGRLGSRVLAQAAAPPHP